MDIEEDEQINTGDNRASLSFFEDEEENKPEDSQLMDDVKLHVVNCEKEGNDYSYKIRVIVNGEERETQRWFKDIQWLHRFLNRNIDLGGYILPPFPDAPGSLPDLPATTLLGSGEAMFGGLNRRHCLRMEKFLSELACHRYFSEHHVIKNYLISTDLSTVIKEREKLGSGTMWSQLTKVYSDYSLGKIQDPDDKLDAYFKSICAIIPCFKSGYEMYSTYIFKWQKLSVQMSEVRNQLKDCSCVDKNSSTALCSSIYSEVMLDMSATEALASLDGALTLAATLSHQTYYLTECKEMLLRRLSAHQSLLTATQQLDKATKPEKKDAAQKVKDKAEEKFNSISEVAKTEVEIFQKQYCRELRQSLLSYTESQIAHARRTLESLAALKTKLRDDLAE